MGRKMKRSKQRFDKPEGYIPEHVSGCRQFEGEDLLYNQRMMKNAELQKEWATQQCRERQAAANAEREGEKAFANQEEAINRMRGMLDDENAQRKAEYQRQIMLENKRGVMTRSATTRLRPR